MEESIMKKILVVVMSILAVLGLSACASTSAQEQEYYVSVDINPSIEFIVDEEDNVVSFELLNEDAEILAADIDFIGMNVEDALALFLEKATEAGYIEITSDENAVLITVLGTEENDEVSALRNRLRNRAQREFAMRNIMASIITEDFTAEDLVEEAENLGISPGKLRLIKVAQVMDQELLIEDAVDLSVRDLLAIIRSHHEEQRMLLTEERIQNRIELREQMMEEHRAALEEHLRANEDLTEEEIAEILQRIDERSNRMRERWEERKQAWEDRMNEQGMPPYNEDNTDEETSDNNPS